MAIDDRYRTLPFAEALAYLRGKVNLDTDSSRDLRDDEHDAFFVVAGAKGSLLSELRVAVDDAITRGVRLEEFQQTFENIAQNWTYNGDAAWRSRMIYQTNLRAAYGRGRDEYQQDPAVQRLQPYLQYIHSDSRAPRPPHIALDGVVFRANEIPWALPAGYNCGCRYISLSQRQLDAQGLAVSTLKKGDTVQVNMPDGRTVSTTLRPDEGWDRQPGQARGARRQELIQRVIDRSPPEIARQIRADVAAFEARRKEALVARLRADGFRFTKRAIIWIEDIGGRAIWLEEGTEKKGLTHILNKQADFMERGIQPAILPELVKEALINGRIIGTQGAGQRPIYRVMFEGRVRYIAITVSENGFVVGANAPDSRILRNILGDSYEEN